MKWYGYLICAILVVVGSFAILDIVQKFSQKSYEIGTLDTTAKYYDNVFNMSLGIIPFTLQNGVYVYSDKLQAVDDFNGNTHSYLTKINGNIVKNTARNATLEINMPMNFVSTNGHFSDSIPLQINIIFYDSYTQVSFACETTSQNMQYMLQYLYSYGFKLDVMEVKA